MYQRRFAPISRRGPEIVRHTADVALSICDKFDDIKPT